MTNYPERSAVPAYSNFSTFSFISCQSQKLTPHEFYLIISNCKHSDIGNLDMQVRSQEKPGFLNEKVKIIDLKIIC